MSSAVPHRSTARDPAIAEERTNLCEEVDELLQLVDQLIARREQQLRRPPERPGAA